MHLYDVLFCFLFLLYLSLRYALKLIGEIVKEHETRIDASLSRIRELETSVRYLRQRDAESSIKSKESAHARIVP